MARVWPDTFVDESNLKFQIGALRRALGDGNRYLANVPGRGYSFTAPVTRSDSQVPLARQATGEKQVHNLPAHLTRVIGRADTVNRLAARLPRQRFLTIVGPGGVGKTTVALAVAEALIPAYEHGVWLIDLAPLGDPRLVPSTLATALGLEIRSEDPLSGVIAFLRDKQMLLALDNCEHVIETAAALALRILKGASGVHILATSREPLRTEGERVYRLSPLQSPPGSTELTAAEALGFPAVQLFVERAAANLDEFEMSDADAPIVAEICRKLEGIPLAIELAAARVDAFGARGLAAHLEDRFRLLTHGRRTALARHQTLRATLDWSYDLLTEPERMVLRRVSVFAGDFTIEAASVVAAGGEVAASQVVHCLSNLVVKSLVVSDISSPMARFRLLETTRAYALEKLTESGEFDQVARRHADFYRDLFERAETEWGRRSRAEMRDAYGRDIDNLRAALNWAFSPTGDASLGVALTIAVVPLWFTLSLMGECRGLVERALSSLGPAATTDARPELELRQALGWTLIVTNLRGAETRGVWTDALELAESVGDEEYQLGALWGLCGCNINIRNCRTALAIAQRLYELARNKGDPAGLAAANRFIGVSLHYTGDQINARRHLERSRDRNFATAYRSPIMRLQIDRLLSTCVVLGPVLWLLGFPDQAMRTAQRNLEVVLAGDDRILTCYALSEAACRIAFFVGDLAAAERYLAMLRDHSARYGLTTYFTVGGDWIHGALLLKRGDIVAGLRLLRTAFDKLSEAGLITLCVPFLGPMAEGLGAAGQMVQGLAAIDQALVQSERNELRWCLPELLRIKGGLVLLDGTPKAAVAAEGLYRQGLDWARRQGALSWELRCATSLARSQRDRGRQREARELLASVYGRFTEGFETADLQTARLLLDELTDVPVLKRGRGG